METRIHLVRHGQTAWNKETRCQGHTDVPLDEVGRRQARELARRLRGLPLLAVYSSDLKRARETAEIVASPHGLPVVAMATLRERNMGRWEGLTWAERERGWPELCLQWESGLREVPDELSMEPYGVLTRRALTVVGELVERHPGGDVAAVTHGGFIAAVLDHLGVPPTERFLGNCAVTTLAALGRQDWWIEPAPAVPEVSA